MEIGDTIKKIIQEFILPEFEIMKAENKEIKTILELTNKRVDDINKRLDNINTHLVDQSRRIDDTNKRIDELRVELRNEINELRVELKEEIGKNTLRIDETNKRIDETNKRIDGTNYRINQLYEVIVRREEHEKLDIRVIKMEQDIAEIKKEIQKKIAA
ncbi:MAG: hypothetical protein AB1567_00785 [bacterium]